MSFFSVNPNPAVLHADLTRHLRDSILVKTAAFNKETSQYCFSKAGQIIYCGGLVGALRMRYYPHYKDNRSKRNWKTVKVKGSSSKQGISVDNQLKRYIELGANAKALAKTKNAMARELIAYWTKEGHTLQAAQLPVEIPEWGKMTQADIITKDAQGDLWLWEVKTGMPVGGYHKQGVFSGGLLDDGGNAVPCTKYNIWQLQLHFTRRALETAGLPIKEARIIQINNVVVAEHQQQGSTTTTLQVRVHLPAVWAFNLSITQYDYVTGGINGKGPFVLIKRRNREESHAAVSSSKKNKQQ